MTGKVTVVNKYKHTPTTHDVYIGRGSPLGNPFSWKTGTHALYRCKDREDSIKQFKEYIDQERRNPEAPATIALNLLRERLRAGEDLELVCFCKPQPCHGDVLRKILLEK